ncbi:PaaI family thioesterase [Alsobacter sp. SYSU M60028]|uniref:PaaI family thioesterase n=1 Tax=Alsobacter ponti TaxID=2962936 RepID=A0ABT1LCH0_9HYPH|nr:PaaI family thioesterase [Alsobacter ponti]MCP8939129.1 PaaI family thioesterase [Alsobacter ponti]
MDATGAPVMTVEEIEGFLDREFPEIRTHGRIYEVERVGPLSARMRMQYHPSQLRPGGTISGPAMMALADLALYVAVLGAIGPVGLAVTTNLNINFLRKPEKRALIADCRLLKLGKRLAVGEVDLRSEGEDDLVAHVTATYSIPPR